MLTQPLERGQRRPRPSLLAHPKYRHKEEKRKLMKMTCKKLRKLEDPESVLCRAVLINNTLRHLQNSAHNSDNISGHHHKQTDSEVTLSIQLDTDDSQQQDLDFLQSEIEFPGPLRDEAADDFLNICERLRHPGHLDHQGGGSHRDSDSQVQEDKQHQQHSQHRQEHSQHQYQQEHYQMHQHHRQEQEHPQHQHQHQHQQDLPQNQHQYQHYQEHPEPQHQHHHVPDDDDPSDARQPPSSPVAVASVAAGGGATCAALSSHGPAQTLCMQCVA